MGIEANAELWIELLKSKPVMVDVSAWFILTLSANSQRWVRCRGNKLEKRSKFRLRHSTYDLPKHVVKRIVFLMHDRMLLEIVNINRSFRSTDERLQLLLVKHPQPYPHKVTIRNTGMRGDGRAALTFGVDNVRQSRKEGFTLRRNLFIELEVADELDVWWCRREPNIASDIRSTKTTVLVLTFHSIGSGDWNIRTIFLKVDRDRLPKFLLIQCES